MLTGLAYLSARTTVYTVTNKRLVMRIGMALPVTINLPFRQIDGASRAALRQRLRRHSAEGDGEGARRLPAAAGRMPGPSTSRHPQPCLRCIANADDVAGLLAAALAGTATAPLARTAAPAADRSLVTSTGGGLSHGKQHPSPQPRSAASAGPELRHGAARPRAGGRRRAWPAISPEQTLPGATGGRTAGSCASSRPPTAA